MATDTTSIVFASSNAGKVRELDALLAPLGYSVIAQGDLGVSDAEETATTFVENALLKARHACRETGRPAIADDSGLEVDALNGAPGLYSARYAERAGRGSGDAANNALLLEQLVEHTGEQARRARFRTVVAVARGAVSARTFRELPPLGLYIHLPWCVRKCPYCDFNSHEAPETIPEIAYVDALLSDLADDMPLVWGRSLSSVFIGGGTPSLFSANALDHLLSGIRALTALSPGTEITMEANPGTVDAGRFKEYRAIGINRLSIGVQSLNDRALTFCSLPARATR